MILLQRAGQIALPRLLHLPKQLWHLGTPGGIAHRRRQLLPRLGEAILPSGRVPLLQPAGNLAQQLRRAGRHLIPRRLGQFLVPQRMLRLLQGQIGTNSARITSLRQLLLHGGQLIRHRTAIRRLLLQPLHRLIHLLRQRIGENPTGQRDIKGLGASHGLCQIGRAQADQHLLPRQRVIAQIQHSLTFQRFIAPIAYQRQWDRFGGLFTNISPHILPVSRHHQQIQGNHPIIITQLIGQYQSLLLINTGRWPPINLRRLRRNKGKTPAGQAMTRLPQLVLARLIQRQLGGLDSNGGGWRIKGRGGLAIWRNQAHHRSPLPFFAVIGTAIGAQVGAHLQNTARWHRKRRAIAFFATTSLSTIPLSRTRRRTHQGNRGHRHIIGRLNPGGKVNRRARPKQRGQPQRLWPTIQADHQSRYGHTDDQPPAPQPKPTPPTALPAHLSQA